MSGKHFWKEKSLEEMTPEEWEQLCDGCGRCCLYKLEDDDGFFYFTNVACRYLDLEKCRCSDYAHRNVIMPTCVLLDAEKANELGWLPPTCAYRLLALGRGLPEWHPLVCGNPNRVHEVGVSVREIAISEEEVDLDQLEDYVFDNFDDPDLEE